MNQGQKQVRVKHIARPVRFAFLVSPHKKEDLLRVFQICTCLWAGRTNVIIPYYKKSPPSWNVRKQKTLPAKEIIEGYIDAFDPDFLVVPDNVRKADLPFPSDRLISISNIQGGGYRGLLGYGPDIRIAIADLHNSEFKYQRRYPLDVILPKPKSSIYRMFTASVFGEFPSETALRRIKDTYKDYLNAVPTTIDETNYFKILTGPYEFPLRTGDQGLRTKSSWPSRLYLFFFDHKSNLDLIDYWNLRASGKGIICIPRVWADFIAKDCSKWLTELLGPYLGHPTARPILLCSRTCDSSETRRFASKLDFDSQHITFQDSYPEFWNMYARGEAYQTNIDKAYFFSKDSEYPLLEGPRLSFEADRSELVHYIEVDEPKIDNESGFRDKPDTSTINEFTFDNIHNSLDLSPIVPFELSSTNILEDTPGKFGKRLTSDGLLVPNRYSSGSYYIYFPQPEDILHALFKGTGYNIKLSDKGRITKEIICILDGVHNVNLLKNFGLIKMFDDMAVSGVLLEEDDKATPSKKPKNRSKTLTKKQLIGVLRSISGNDRKYAEETFKSLVNKGIVRLGYLMQCMRCLQHTWLEISNLDYMNICERCLNEMRFPIDDPESGKWTYRVVGPFSIEKYALGSYTVALALNFFSGYLFGSATCMPSFEICKRSKAYVEVDFGVVWRSFFKRDNRPVIIFGECITRGSFDEDDIKRFKRIINIFKPGAFAFCTLNESLSNKEVDLIKPLAEEHRDRIKSRGQSTAIFVLTMNELMTVKNVTENWKDKGIKQKSFNRYCENHMDLHRICFATQELYLGMNPVI